MNTIPGHVAIYCRISHDPLRQEVGVDRQRSDCIALSEATWPGLPSVLYTDNDLTAANEAVLRPAWQRMLNDIRSGEAVQLVAYEQSRLTRQPIEWEQLLIAPGRRGITSIHTVREGEKLIAEGPGRMVSRIMAAVDAEFAETTKLRVRRAMRQLAVEGRPNGGRPFGYRSGLTEDGRKTRLIVPEEAALIRWACSRILSGDTLASIARSFDKRGVTHVKKGRTWSPNHVRSMVTNPTVAGLRPDPDGTLLRAIWEPIIPRGRWERVRACLTGPRVLVKSDGSTYRASRARRPARRHLLSGGLASCGVCGAPLTAQIRRSANRADIVTYICNPHLGRTCVGIVGHRLEPVVITAFFDALGQQWLQDRLTRPTSSAMIRTAQRLERIEAELATLAHSFGAGELLKAEWRAARVELARRAEDLRRVLTQGSIPAYGSPEEIVARWDRIGVAGKRALLAAAFDRIEVHRQEGHARPSDRIKLVWSSQ